MPQTLALIVFAALIVACSAAPTPTQSATSVPSTSAARTPNTPAATASALPSPTAARTATAAPAASATAAPSAPAAPTPTAAPVNTVAAPTHAPKNALSGAGPVAVGGGKAKGVAPAPDGRTLFLTGPNGELWRAPVTGADPPILIDRAPAPPNVLAVAAERLVGGAMEACARGGSGTALRFSTDGGRTWAPSVVTAGASPMATPWLVRGDEVFALGCGGVLISADGGTSYSGTPRLSIVNYDPRDLALAPDGKAVYVAGISEGGTLVVTRSDRATGGWSPPSTVDRGWGAAALALAPDGRVYVGTATGIRTSTDRGATWQSVPTRGLEAELLGSDPTKGVLSDADQKKLRDGTGVTDLAVVGDALYAATRHGVYISRAGGAWQQRPEAVGNVTRLRIAGTTVYAIATDGVVRLG